MISFDSYLDEQELARSLDAAADEMVSMAGPILEMVGMETVAYLRSLTEQMQPPARKGEPPRQAHPGGWADITSQLANAYAFEVVTDGDGSRLVLTNNTEYAAALDAKDGYFVLSGVLDKRGPVHDALVRVVSMIAPEWEVRYG